MSNYELSDEELLFATQAMETEEVEELALRLGPEKHEAFFRRHRRASVTEGKAL